MRTRASASARRALGAESGGGSLASGLVASALLMYETARFSSLKAWA